MDTAPLIVETTEGYKVYVEYHRGAPNAETILLVNGALATTVSYSQTVKYLTPRFNVVLYDVPYAGRSREHNENCDLLTKDDEVQLLLQLIDRYKVDYLASMSWGGVAALLALTHRPPSIKKALIGSFSPVLNGPMLDYLYRGNTFLQNRDSEGAANLLNCTVGKYLPRLLKAYNYRYLLSLPESEHTQIAFHIEQISKLDLQDYAAKMSAINVPVLFFNGELDEYTTPSDVQALARHIKDSHFLVVPAAGHFLELEGKRVREQIRDLTFDFIYGERAVSGAVSGEPASPRRSLLFPESRSSGDAALQLPC